MGDDFVLDGEAFVLAQTRLNASKAELDVIDTASLLVIPKDIPKKALLRRRLKLIDNYSLSFGNWDTRMTTFKNALVSSSIGENYSTLFGIQGSGEDVYKRIEDIEQKISDLEIDLKYATAVSAAAGRGGSSSFTSSITRSPSEIQKEIIDLKNERDELKKDTVYNEDTWQNDFANAGKQIVNSANDLLDDVASGDVNESYKSYIKLKDEVYATKAVVDGAIASGIAVVGEALCDAATVVLGIPLTVVTGAADLLNYTAAKITGGTFSSETEKMWNSLMDEVSTNHVENVKNEIYEETTIGRNINEKSALKYDSTGAKSIQSAATETAKFAITIIPGGGTVTAVASAGIALGEVAQKEYQKEDRKPVTFEMLFATAAGYSSARMNSTIFGGAIEIGKKGIATGVSNLTKKVISNFTNAGIKSIARQAFLSKDSAFDAVQSVIEKAYEEYESQSETGKVTLGSFISNTNWVSFVKKCFVEYIFGRTFDVGLGLTDDATSRSWIREGDGKRAKEAIRNVGQSGIVDSIEASFVKDNTPSLTDKSKTAERLKTDSNIDKDGNLFDLKYPTLGDDFDVKTKAFSDSMPSGVYSLTSGESTPPVRVKTKAELDRSSKPEEICLSNLSSRFLSADDYDACWSNDTVEHVTNVQGINSKTGSVIGGHAYSQLRANEGVPFLADPGDPTSPVLTYTITKDLDSGNGIRTCEISISDGTPGSKPKISTKTVFDDAIISLDSLKADAKEALVNTKPSYSYYDTAHSRFKYCVRGTLESGVSYEAYMFQDLEGNIGFETIYPSGTNFKNASRSAFEGYIAKYETPAQRAEFLAGVDPVTASNYLETLESNDIIALMDTKDGPTLYSNLSPNQAIIVSSKMSSDQVENMFKKCSTTDEKVEFIKNLDTVPKTSLLERLGIDELKVYYNDIMTLDGKMDYVMLLDSNNRKKLLESLDPKDFVDLITNSTSVENKVKLISGLDGTIKNNAFDALTDEDLTEILDNSQIRGTFLSDLDANQVKSVKDRVDDKKFMKAFNDIKDADSKVKVLKNLDDKANVVVKKLGRNQVLKIFGETTDKSGLLEIIGKDYRDDLIKSVFSEYKFDLFMDLDLIKDLSISEQQFILANVVATDNVARTKLNILLLFDMNSRDLMRSLSLAGEAKTKTFIDSLSEAEIKEIFSKNINFDMIRLLPPNSRSVVLNNLSDSTLSFLLDDTMSSLIKKEMIDSLSDDKRTSLFKSLSPDTIKSLFSSKSCVPLFDQLNDEQAKTLLSSLDGKQLIQLLKNADSVDTKYRILDSINKNISSLFSEDDYNFTVISNLSDEEIVSLFNSEHSQELYAMLSEDSISKINDRMIDYNSQTKEPIFGLISEESKANPNFIGIGKDVAGNVVAPSYTRLKQEKGYFYNVMSLLSKTDDPDFIKLALSYVDEMSPDEIVRTYENTVFSNGYDTSPQIMQRVKERYDILPNNLKRKYDVNLFSKEGRRIVLENLMERYDVTHQTRIDLFGDISSEAESLFSEIFFRNLEDPENNFPDVSVDYLLQLNKIIEFKERFPLYFNEITLTDKFRSDYFKKVGKPVKMISHYINDNVYFTPAVIVNRETSVFFHEEAHAMLDNTPWVDELDQENWERMVQIARDRLTVSRSQPFQSDSVIKSLYNRFNDATKVAEELYLYDLQQKVNIEIDSLKARWKNEAKTVFNTPNVDLKAIFKEIFPDKTIDKITEVLKKKGVDSASSFVAEQLEIINKNYFDGIRIKSIDDYRSRCVARAEGILRDSFSDFRKEYKDYLSDKSINKINEALNENEIEKASNIIADLIIQTEFSSERNGLIKTYYETLPDKSDIINAIMGSEPRVPFGHEDDYYKNFSNQIHEAFANYASLKASSDPDADVAIEELRDYLGNDIVDALDAQYRQTYGDGLTEGSGNIFDQMEDRYWQEHKEQKNG